MNYSHTLGVDIAKAKFDVALHAARSDTNTRKDKCAVFANNPAGFESLLQWLAKHSVALDSVHVAMEATGIYYEQLAQFLCAKGLAVSVINPSRISGFAQANLSRTKTDKADAKLIARYCDALQPALWLAPSPHVHHLRELTRRLADLKDLQQQESSRLPLAHATHDSVAAIIGAIEAQINLVNQAIKDHIDKHPDLKEQARLLNTIPGVGVVTIGTLLAEVEFERFERAAHLAAFTGLAPKISESGTSLHSRGRLSKTGSSTLRRSLYMPAIVAMQHNSVIKTFYQRLLANGKSKMQAVCACMRKLLCIAFGVLKSKRAFDPNYAISA